MKSLTCFIFFAYVDANREEDFFARKWTGKKWVRKVKPHGKEWKRIAITVGVKEPKAASDGNARKIIVKKWRVVIVNNSGTIDDTECGYDRFPKKMSARYMRGRKRETLGKLFLVKGEQWKEYVAGRLPLSSMSFYQDLHAVPVSHGIKGLIQ